MPRKNTTKALGGGKGDKLAQLLKNAQAISGGEVAVADLPEHERLHQAVVDAHATFKANSIEMACAMYDAHVGNVFVKLGYESEDDYWLDRFDIQPRTADRMISVGEVLGKLPEGDRPYAKAALSRIGIHKAEIIRPMIQGALDAARSTEAPAVVHWREWADKAEQMPRSKLQGEVSEARGARPRGRPRGGSTTDTGVDPFLLYVANKMPTVETRDLFMRVVALGYRLAGTDSTVGVLIAMCQEILPEWELRAGYETGQPPATPVVPSVPVVAAAEADPDGEDEPEVGDLGEGDLDEVVAER